MIFYVKTISQSLITYRLLGLFSLFILYFTLPKTHYLVLLSGIGLGHYALAVWYSRQKIKKSLQDGYSATSLVVLFLLSIVAFVYQIPSIVVLFGIHHVFSEIYLCQSFYPHSKSHRSELLAGARFVFHALGYFIIAYSIKPFRYQFLAPYLIAYGIIALLYFALIWVKSERKEKLDMIGSEFLFVLFILACVHWKMGFWNALFYHFIFWVFFPLQKIATFSPPLREKSIKTYVVQTIFISALCIAVAYSIDWDQMHPLFFIQTSKSVEVLGALGYVHIMISFLLSGMNPNIIKKILGPREHFRVQGTSRSSA